MDWLIVADLHGLVDSLVRDLHGLVVSEDLHGLVDSI